MRTFVSSTGLDIPDVTTRHRRWGGTWTTPQGLRLLTAVGVVSVLILGAVLAGAVVDLRGGWRRTGNRVLPTAAAGNDLTAHLHDVELTFDLLLFAGTPDPAGTTDPDRTTPGATDPDGEGSGGSGSERAGSEREGSEREGSGGTGSDRTGTANSANATKAAKAAKAAKDAKVAAALADYQRAVDAVRLDLMELAALADSARERRRIDNIRYQFGVFERLAVSARQEQRRAVMAGKPDPVGGSRASAVTRMRNALRPDAETFSRAADIDLADRMRDGGSGAALGWSVLLGIVAIGSLVATQTVLPRRQRRAVNPALAAATVLAFSLTVWGAAMLDGQQDRRDDLKGDVLEPLAAAQAARSSSVATDDQVVQAASVVPFQDRDRMKALLRGEDSERRDRAVESLVRLHRAGFERRVDDGLADLDVWGTVPAAGTFLIVGLLLVGVRPRLAEYR